MTVKQGNYACLVMCTALNLDIIIQRHQNAQAGVPSWLRVSPPNFEVEFILQKWKSFEFVMCNYMFSSILIHRQKLFCSGHLVRVIIQVNKYYLFPFVS